MREQLFLLILYIVTAQKNFQLFQALLEQTSKAALSVKTSQFLLQKAKWCKDKGLCKVGVTVLNYIPLITKKKRKIFLPEGEVIAMN